MQSLCAAYPCRQRVMAVLLGGWALTLADLLAGCGPRGPALAEISGTVTLDGQPLARGIVTFEAAGLRPATAHILDGRIIEVTTHRPNDGVPVGHQRIAVFSRAEPGPAKPGLPPPRAPSAAGGFPPSMAGPSLLPARYNDPKTSGLTVIIRPGHNTVSLALQQVPP